MPVSDFKNMHLIHQHLNVHTQHLIQIIIKQLKNILYSVLDNEQRKWENNSVGMFANPYKKTAFEFQMEECEYIKRIYSG